MFLLPAWLSLNAFDVALTWIGINLGAFEASPHLGALAAMLGLEAMLLFKLASATAVGAVLWKRNAVGVFRGVNVAMAAVVIFNAMVVMFLI